MATKPPAACPHCHKRTDALVGINGEWSCVDCLNGILAKALAPVRQIQALARRAARKDAADGS